MKCPSAQYWRPQEESNLQLALRRGSLYPFNYGDTSHANFKAFAVIVKQQLLFCHV